MTVSRFGSQPISCAIQAIVQSVEQPKCAVHKVYVPCVLIVCVNCTHDPWWLLVAEITLRLLCLWFTIAQFGPEAAFKWNFLGDPEALFAFGMAEVVELAQVEDVAAEALPGKRPLPLDVSKLPMFKGDATDVSHLDSFLVALGRYFRVNADLLRVDPGDEIKLGVVAQCFPFGSIASIWYEQKLRLTRLTPLKPESALSFQLVKRFTQDIAVVGERPPR